MDYGISNNQGKTHPDEVKKILNLASANSIGSIDTAMSYGNSEEVIGTVDNNNFKIITKLPEVPEQITDIPNWIESNLLKSLKKLRCSSIDSLLLHYPDQLLEKKSDIIYKSLDSLKEKKLVKKIGISIYEPSQLDFIIPRFDFDIVQSPLNIADRRIINSGWSSKLRKRKIELHVRSIFLQGLMLVKKEEIEKKFKLWDVFWNNWYEWLNETNITPLNACLNFSLQHEDVSKVIIGTQNANQLQEILNNIDNKFIRVPDWSKDVTDNLVNPSAWGSL